MKNTKFFPPTNNENLARLKKFVSIAEKVVDKKASLPFLLQVCVKNGNILATDLETILVMKIDDERNYTAPLKVLEKIIKTKPKEIEIKLEETQPRVKIIFDGKSVSFPYMDTEEYPEEPIDEFRQVGLWSKDIFLKLYMQLSFVSNERIKNSLTGVCIEQEEKLSSCGTDGHALRYIKNLDIENNCELLMKDFNIILSRKIIEILTRIDFDFAGVFKGERYIKFELSDDIILYSRPIEGMYPDFRKVIPTEQKNKIIFDRKEMLNALKQAKPFVSKTTEAIKLIIKGKEITIVALDVEEDIGFEISFLCEEHRGVDLTIGFALSYLVRGLNAIKGNTVIWKYKDNISQQLFFDSNDVEENEVNLVMPRKLSN